MKNAKQPPVASSRPALKMSDLVRATGVPAATIKHYMREGLLPPPVRRTGRNMVYYDPATTTRVEAIKALQQQHFLPLKVIRDVLEGRRDDTLRAAEATLERLAPRAIPRAEVVALLESEAELVWLEKLGAVTSMDGTFSQDDRALVEILTDARRRGLTKEMLPVSILAEYVAAIHALVRVEVALFTQGVLPRAGANAAALTEVAAELSERLVLLLRRKAILPTLRAATTPPVARTPRATTRRPAKRAAEARPSKLTSPRPRKKRTR